MSVTSRRIRSFRPGRLMRTLGGAMLTLAGIQACRDVRLEEVPAPPGAVAVSSATGYFCVPLDASVVSTYRLSDFYLLNATATKFGGLVALDNNSNGIADVIAMADGSKQTVTVDATDSSGDGLPDFVKELRGLNPVRDDLNEDPDLDGVVNKHEVQQMTDPFSSDDAPLIEYTVQESSVVQSACGVGQPVYELDVANIPLVLTQGLEDQVNSSAYSLSHLDKDENVIVMLARMVPTDVRNDAIFLISFTRLSAQRPLDFEIAPEDFSILGSITGETCSVNCGGNYLGNAYKAVAVGLRHSCALSSVGSVFCWGDNSYGQLGDGTTMPRATPVAAILGIEATAIGAGDDHTCALTRTNQVFCWGGNLRGQLGRVTDGVFSPVPIAIAIEQGPQALQLSVGGQHTCASFGDNSVRCWGRNDNYQLGDGTTIDRFAPSKTVIAATLMVQFPLASMSSGRGHNCLLDKLGRAFCWGQVLANGRVCYEDHVQSVPTTLAGGSGCTGLRFPGDEGDGYQLRRFTWKLLVTNGAANYGVPAIGWDPPDPAVCWMQPGVIDSDYPTYDFGCGQNEDGDYFTDALPRVGKLSLGDNHGCGIYHRITVVDGQNVAIPMLACWGSNSYGQTGLPPDPTPTVNGGPSPVGAVVEPIAVAAGPYHTCAIDHEGVLWCWGRNDYAQLGTGDAVSTYTPTQVLFQ